MLTIPELLKQANDLKSLAENVQNESIPLSTRETILSDLYEQYHIWYRQALAYFERADESEKKEKFEKEYEGTFWTSQILSFLTEGLKPNVLFKADNPQLPKWQHPVILRFQQPIEKQCNILSTLQIHFESKTQQKNSANYLAVRISKSALKANIESKFDKNDIVDLCFDLDIDHQNFQDQTRRGMARELIENMVKLNRLEELLIKVLSLRNLTQDELQNIFPKM
ncbi:MAG: hypothetical protein R3D55_21070 [Chloroflexota bacterium]